MSLNSLSAFVLVPVSLKSHFVRLCPCPFRGVPAFRVCACARLSPFRSPSQVPRCAFPFVVALVSVPWCPRFLRLCRCPSLSRSLSLSLSLSLSRPHLVRLCLCPSLGSSLCVFLQCSSQVPTSCGCACAVFRFVALTTAPPPFARAAVTSVCACRPLQCPRSRPVCPVPVCASDHAPVPVRV